MVYGSFKCTCHRQILCTHGELLLHGTRIVVLKILRNKIVKLAQEGHQDVVKSKYQL